MQLAHSRFRYNTKTYQELESENGNAGCSIHSIVHLFCKHNNPLGFHPSELVAMPCKSCGSVNQQKCSAEMCIHFSDIDKPVVWLFPEVVVCLDCGTAELAVPEAELRQLAKGDAAAAAG